MLTAELCELARTWKKPCAHWQGNDFRNYGMLYSIESNYTAATRTPDELQAHNWKKQITDYKQCNTTFVQLKNKTKHHIAYE